MIKVKMKLYQMKHTHTHTHNDEPQFKEIERFKTNRRTFTDYIYKGKNDGCLMDTNQHSLPQRSNKTWNN